MGKQNYANVLAGLFSSHTRIKLITLFVTNKNRAFFVREISRKIGERINSVRRELENLSQIGFLKSFPQKNKLYYKVQPNFVVFNELRSIIHKTTDVKDDMSEKFRNIGDVILVVLAGVFSGVKDNPTDILIVGDNMKRPALEKVILEIEEEISESIRYTVLSSNDYILRDSLGDRFLTSVMQGENTVILDERHKKKRVQKKNKLIK